MREDAALCSVFTLEERRNEKQEKLRKNRKIDFPNKFH
jgi:hypothetical protein